MSTRIAVRLPDHLVEFVNEVVANGGARSRASLVATALERERQRAMAARDASILAESGDDSDMDSLAEHVAELQLDGLK